jgi:hypothetical protein
MAIPEEKTVTNQQSTDKVAVDTSKDYNFAQVRKQLQESTRAAEQAKREAEQAKQELEALKRGRDEQEDYDSSSEPYVEHRTLDKRIKKLEENFEKKIERQAEMKARAIFEQHQQQTFLRNNPDFNEIMSPELLQKFGDKHPSIAESLMAMPDSFDRQKLVYENIKALGIHKPPEKPPIQETIEKRRVSAYYQPTEASTPPYAANPDCSEAGQKAAYEKIQAIMKGRRG